MMINHKSYNILKLKHFSVVLPLWHWVVVLSLCFIVSCTTALSGIENDIKDLTEGVESLQSSIKELHDAYNSGKIIKSATEITEGNGGWLITFSDNTTIKLENGAPELQGENGDKSDTEAQCPQDEQGESSAFTITQDVTHGIITIVTPTNETFMFNLDVVFPTSVIVLDKEVKLTHRGTATMRIRVNPSNAVLTSEMITFDVVTSRASYVNAPKHYKIAEVVADTNEEGELLDGQFVLTIEDLGTNGAYNDNIAVCCDTKDSQRNDIQVSSELFNISKEKFALPTVYVNTPNGVAITSKEIWTEGCTMEIVDEDGTVTDLGTMSFRGRGNSTWSYPKKPFAITLDEKKEVLGMPKHKRWVLLANWMDRTLMRNAVALEVGKKTKSLEWTPHGQFVEVVLNGKHIGNYFLCEQIKIDENRVNIAELKADDVSEDIISGGYLFELDTYYDEVNKFRTAKCNLPVMFKEPDEDVISAEHIAYAKNYFDQVESYLYDTDTPNEKYRDMIDMDTFIDWWFVYELVQNSEPNHPKSSYMFKDRDAKLKAGPIWDFDLETFIPGQKSWYIKNAIWYNALFKDSIFVARVQEKWAESKDDFASVVEFIDATAAKIKESNDRNIEMWPITSKVNGDESMSTDEAVARLKQAYTERIQWMTTAIAAFK